MIRNLITPAERDTLFRPPGSDPPPAELGLLLATESQLQRTVEGWLTLKQWRWFHDNPVTVCPNPRCRTPIPPRNNPGFPDLIGTDGRTLLAVELKTMKGRAKPEQVAWDGLLATVTQFAGGIYRPHQLNELEQIIFNGGW